ncbi:MAG TPA: hypothetical protein VGG42_18185 [Acidobacteriaceae bacterium]|jgi:hypothetical protein
MGRGWRVVWVAGALALAAGLEAWADESRETRTADAAASSATRAGEGSATPGVERVQQAAGAPEDPCAAAVISQPARPMWTAGAQTTQCGVMENDLGWHWMELGGGVRQRGLTSAERYGITRSLDVTWSLPMRLVESGGDRGPVGGITDQSVSVMYEFQQQGRWVPAMAVSYGGTIPTANPAKGFGSGYADHQLAFLASRDVRQVHFDFNLAGLLAGGPEGHDGATESGLVMAVPVPRVKGLGWLLESDGGSEPGTEDRFGQALTGLSWAVRPNLVLDTAYTRAYTAGAPREQFTMGVTWAHRVGWLHSAAEAVRLLGQ